MRGYGSINNNYDETGKKYYRYLENHVTSDISTFPDMYIYNPYIYNALANIN